MDNIQLPIALGRKSQSDCGIPSKLKHIKNKLILTNSFDYIKQKYVKKIWAHKKTKINRNKVDLIWEYYSHRRKQSVKDTIIKTYYKNVKDITIIYFSDSVQHRFIIDDNMVKQLKNISN